MAMPGPYAVETMQKKAEATQQFKGGEITASQWAAATGFEPGTIQYQMTVGRSPAEFADLVSGLQSQIAQQRAPAISQVAQTRSGFVDPSALSSVSTRMEAARVAGLAQIERGNLAIRAEARGRWEEYRRQRNRNIISTIVDIATLGVFAAGRRGAAAGLSAGADILSGFGQMPTLEQTFGGPSDMGPPVLPGGTFVEPFQPYTGPPEDLTQAGPLL